MERQGDRQNAIHCAAKAYRHGVICAAEVWKITFNYVTQESVSRVLHELHELSAEDEVTLRSAYQPHYVDNCSRDGVRMAVEQWLESSKRTRGEIRS